MTRLRSVGIAVAMAILFSALMAATSVRAQSAPMCANNRIMVAEQGLDAPMNQLVWVNSTEQDIEAIFVLTQAHTVYRSRDHGRTFTSQSATLRGITKIVQTANPKIIYFIGNGALWTTEDQGDHYTSIPTTLRILNIVAHPINPSWALAYVETAKCTDGTKPGFCHYDLFLTENTGVTWTLKATYVQRDQFDWGDAGRDKVPEGNVYWISYNAKNVDQRILDPYNLEFQRTKDLFRTIDYTRPHSLAFKFYQRDLLIAQLVPNDKDADLALFASTDAGTSFTHCDFPTAVKEYGYTILDLSEGAAFVNVAHDTTGAWGTTYSSDVDLHKFALSLKYVKRQARSGRADFKRIKGLDGIYMANKLDVDEDDPTNDDTRGYSMVSFDKGGMWETLQAPALDLNNQPPCAGCRLNLLGFDGSHRGTKAFYSRNNAPGVVMASGVVGKWLLDRPDEINTFMSYDAGMSWKEIAKGEHIYEINNFGGLTLLAKTYEAATEIMYSWNQGSSFTTCGITTLPFEVVDVFSAPSATDLNFLIYGVRGSKGVMVHVDFSQFGARQCSDSDYEHWSPSDVRGGKCLMGQRASYLRRKEGSECFNPQSHQYPLPDVSFCDCARADFTCDHCYEPSPTDPSICVLSPDCPSDPTLPPPNCDGTYLKTRGYRKVPGNKCKQTGSSPYMPVKTTCSGHETGGGKSGGDGGGLTGAAIFGIVLLVLTALCGICGVGAFVAYRYVPAVHDAVEPHLPTAATAENLWSMLPKRSSSDGGPDYSVLTAGSEPQSLLDDLGSTGDDDTFGDAQAPKKKGKSTSFLDDDDSLF